MMNNSTGTKKTQTKGKAKKAEDGKRARTQKQQTPQTPPSPSLDSRTFIKYTPPQSPVRSDDDELMAVGSGTIIQYTPPQSPMRNGVDEDIENHVSVPIAKPFRERVEPPPAINTQLTNNVSSMTSTEESEHLQRTPVELRDAPFPDSSDSARSPVSDPWFGWTHMPTDATSSSSPHPFGSEGPFGSGIENKSEQTKKKKKA